LFLNSPHDPSRLSFSTTLILLFFFFVVSRSPFSVRRLVSNMGMFAPPPPHPPPPDFVVNFYNAAHPLYCSLTLSLPRITVCCGFPLRRPARPPLSHDLFDLGMHSRRSNHTSLPPFISRDIKCARLQDACDSLWLSFFLNLQGDGKGAEMPTTSLESALWSPGCSFSSLSVLRWCEGRFAVERRDIGVREDRVAQTRRNQLWRSVLIQRSPPFYEGVKSGRWEFPHNPFRKRFQAFFMRSPPPPTGSKVFQACHLVFC